MIASLAMNASRRESKDFVAELYGKSFMGMFAEDSVDTAREIFIVNLTIEGLQISCEEAE